MPKKMYSRILVATNGLKSSDSTHETAFSLAKKRVAEVLLVDTVRPLSLLSRCLSTSGNDILEMVIADKQQRLGAIAENFRSSGVKATAKVLFGKSSEAISRAAIDWDASLVVSYKKGVRSSCQEIFGNTARSLMRYCPTPLLLVGQKTIDRPRVLACIDTDHGEEENASIMAESARLSDEKKNLSGLYCWQQYAVDGSQKRMTEGSFEKSMEFAESVFKKSYDRFIANHDLSAFADGIRIEYGEASNVIPKFCQLEKVDVAVMCSATLNHPLKRLLGSTVESVVNELPCALLVVKAVGFVSPIRGSEVAAASV